MKKKVIAGVAALLMVASCVPANTAFNFAPAATITASAADSTIDIGDLQVTVDKENNVSLSVSDLMSYLGFDEHETDVVVDLSGVKADIEEAVGSLEGRKVTLSAPTDNKKPLKTYANIAKIKFVDDVVTCVGKNFAKDCVNLENVDFGDHITEIGQSAFQGCTHLVGTNSNVLEMPNIVTIGNSAFKGCSILEELAFGENLATIDASAFESASNITNLNLPASVATIGDKAFTKCSQLHTVIFNDDNTLSYIGVNAFQSCALLKTVTLNGLNYNTLPNGTEDLIGGSGIFSGCATLQNFTWPDEWVLIPDKCFQSCTSLNDFNFGSGVDVSQCGQIGAYAFEGCTALLSIELPDANFEIGGYAFNGCTKLENVVVSDTLALVGAYAFQDCWVLNLYPRSTADVPKNNTVILPDTWQSISKACFKHCVGLTHLDLSPATSIDEEAFMNCVDLPDVVLPEAVKTIPKKCFQGCVSLKDVTVSSVLGTLDESAFEGCTVLDSLTPSDMSKLDGTLQFPASLGGVQKKAFKDCENIKYINFTDDAKFSVLGANAFEGCKGLLGSNVGGNANHTIEMPVGVTVIQEGAFKGAASLERIQFLGNVTSINANAFEDCVKLEDVEMNDTIKQIGGSAFKGCTALKQMPRTPEGKPAFSQVEILNTSTFENCTSLENAFIPKNVSTIDSNAFKKCTSMTDVTWEEGSALKVIGASAFEGCESMTRFSYADGGDVTEFPGSLKNIYDNAFSKTGLLNVKIGTPSDGSVIYLGKNILADSKQLDTLDLSESNIVEIPEGCCSKCENLKTVYVPEETLVKIGNSAFYQCHFLHTLGKKSDKAGEYTIPDTLSFIGSKAFEDNFSMQVLNIPERSTWLSLSMLNIYYKEEDVEKYGYTPLEWVNVDENNPNYKSVDGILYSKDMTTLMYRPVYMQGDSFTVPDVVENIGEYGLAANSFLTNVTLNENLKSLGDHAFNDCHNLESVDFGSNGTVEIGKDVIKKAKGKTVFYGTANSTAQAYAEKNSSKVDFVDNAKTAAELAICDKDGNVIDGEMILAFKSKSYQFTVKQTTASGDEAADTLVWSVDDPEIATINDKGVLSVKAMGEVTVSIRNANKTASTSVKITINEEGPAAVTLGDVNGDGDVNVTDVVLTAAHVKSIRALSDEGLKAGDINGDGDVNVTDLAALAAHVKGIRALPAK
ncbi:leucine-rich repeat protein [Ruminococcus sp.]|uniref:leucine-rich repeat protein n=1 Tax=Ruminococcus sp. TaxID=41978 RepID=UPI0025EDF798|nr:leucine-rich repeat protein [Ruminococcus sp.]MBQ8967072.1 leucine-rich repeat protein [Ruminococcus sp.]